MNRRTMLRRTVTAVATASTVAAAGCVDGGEEPATDEPTEESTPDPTDEPTEEPTEDPDDGQPGLREIDLERQGNCEGRGHSAEVSSDAEDETVTIDGCFEAHNGCIYPELDHAAYAEDGTFVVTVEGVDESEPDEACTQAVEYRAYEVVATFDGGIPGSVAVRHDGETVTSTDAE